MHACMPPQLLTSLRAHLFVMGLTTEVDQIPSRTGEAPLHVRSTVQSLRLVKNLIHVLHGSGVFHFAYLPQEERPCVCHVWWGINTHLLAESG